MVDFKKSLAVGVAVLSALTACAAASGVSGNQRDGYCKGVFPPCVRTIGVVMPASVYQKSRFDRDVAALRTAGYRVKVAPRIRFDQLASPQDRAQDLVDMWSDPEVDLVLCARGGSRVERIVPYIDWARLKKRPDMIFLGYSDITVLHNAMLKEGVGRLLSGPTMSSFASSNAATKEWLCRAIVGAEQPPVKLHALKAGAFSGYPVGGHAHRYSIALRSGCALPGRDRVVFLESEESISPQRLAETFDYLVSSGSMDRAAGVIFGEVKSKPGSEEEVERLKRDFAARVRCPVYDGFDYGHGKTNLTVDHLRKVSVDAEGLMRW